MHHFSLKTYLSRENPWNKEGRFRLPSFSLKTFFFPKFCFMVFLKTQTYLQNLFNYPSHPLVMFSSTKCMPLCLGLVGWHEFTNTINLVRLNIRIVSLNTRTSRRDHIIISINITSAQWLPVYTVYITKLKSKLDILDFANHTTIRATMQHVSKT